ncbi:MAG: hypothetical protein HY362_03720 [Candidatus Aenigmarchaeota archaeon]|nr:hypothetical protein [Candidatus Aenigmarchaeota archaeon]
MKNIFYGTIAGAGLGFLLGFFIYPWNFIIAGAATGFLGARGPTFTKNIFSAFIASIFGGILFLIVYFSLPILSEFLPFIFLPTSDFLSLLLGPAIMVIFSMLGGATKSLLFSRAES